MRCAVGLFVHVNLLALGQRHAEFLLNRSFGIPKKTFAKVAVFTSFQDEEVGCVDGLLH